MRQRTNVIVLIALLLFAVMIGVGLWYTAVSNQATTLSGRKDRTTGEQQVWRSQRSFETARQFSKLANTRDEDRLARQAVQVADHELDTALTAAMRETQLNPPPAAPQVKEIRSRIQQLEINIKSANDRVVKISAEMNSSRTANVDALQQELDVTEAKLTLFSQELDDAKQDLLRFTDDPESRLQKQIEAHKSAYHTAAAAEQANPAARLPVFAVPTNMAQQLRAVNVIRGKLRDLQAAAEVSRNAAKSIDATHAELEKQLGTLTAPTEENTVSQVKALERMSEQRKLVADYARRQQDQVQLAQIYGSWSTLLDARQVAIVHGMLRMLLAIVVVLVLMVLADIAIDRYYGRTKLDRRRSLTLRLLARIAVRFVCALVILFVVFGSPREISMILGLATAGLTVALKDFIVAFFGWFVIMGRNGIRVGDWVEINGISGEVVEIGLLRTVLLETGNLADSGHPTGRRVTFVNSFAIERHFFNFSTTGQWLWDSIEVLVPESQDPNEVTETIRGMVMQATSENGRLAEHEWQRVTHKYGVQPFSATPSVDMRPTANGIILCVRYITRAQERYELRTRLYKQVVDMLREDKLQPSS